VVQQNQRRANPIRVPSGSQSQRNVQRASEQQRTTPPVFRWRIGVEQGPGEPRATPELGQKLGFGALQQKRESRSSHWRLPLKQQSKYFIPSFPNSSHQLPNFHTSRKRQVELYRVSQLSLCSTILQSELLHSTRPANLTGARVTQIVDKPSILDKSYHDLASRHGSLLSQEDVWLHDLRYLTQELLQPRRHWFYVLTIISQIACHARNPWFLQDVAVNPPHHSQDQSSQGARSASRPSRLPAEHWRRAREMPAGTGKGKGKSIEPFRCRHGQVRGHDEICRFNYQGSIPAISSCVTILIIGLVQRDFDPDYSSIPPHGRWQHFNAGGRDRIAELLSSWPHDIDPSERCRRLIDLFLVSVLLDAGAGTAWSYKSKQNGRIYKRSEGLAIASFEMFKDGLFSSNKQQRHQVDAAGLRELTVEKMTVGLQVTEQNPMSGLEGRASLLIRLADALNNDTLFGADGRPGNMLGKSPP
jgi:Protein of unknown function (DUF1688)